jgi:MFS family permease
VLHLTNSAFAVGLVTALGTLPILCFTLYGGVVADRVNKHRLVLILQAGMLVEALVLGILVHLDLVTVNWVMGLAVCFGLLSAFEVPTRQALIAEIVEREDLMNAIALGSTAFNVARVVGPAVAGALIATVGLAACFFVNAASYLAVIASLLLMRPEPRPAVEITPALDAMREGFRYVFGNRWPRAIVTIIATFAVFGFSFMPMLPVFARDALHLDARGYGASWPAWAGAPAGRRWCSARRCCSARFSSRRRWRPGSGRRSRCSPWPAVSWRSTASRRTPRSRSRPPTGSGDG